MVDDVQDLLIHVDIMITDYSSVFMDYCLTDRQVIFYPYDIEEYTTLCRKLKIDYFNDFPGPFVKDENELIDCIKNISEISSNKDYQKKYQEFKDRYHFYQDGNSSQRLYSYLMSNHKVD